ncbi:MAG: endonuclease/exonuclease/phosphatase family protein [Planctomycetales bacterium]|nr:endonuclease/exonuclease/phosphatase family protein [Planctomycetales bacterium]
MRLLTYNIHKGIGGRDRRYRFERIIEVIEHENPDLMCLQEVVRHAPRVKNHNQPRLFSTYFRPAETLFQMNVHYQRGGYGNLLLSRWPFASYHNIGLRKKEKKPRGAQLVVVDSPEGPFQLINLHLGLAEPERHWQIEQLLAHRLYDEAAHLPTLIAGDTNDWRNTLIEGDLARHGYQLASAPISRHRTFPAWLPVGALDKAFVKGGIDVKEVRVVKSKQSRRASDHLPLVIDFHLKAGDP